MTLPIYPTDQDINLDPIGTWPLSVHRFDSNTATALRAAEAAGRPLLLRGLPGTGKSQTARAAAAITQRLFISVTIDGRSEARDLLWTHDAVARLSDAHAPGAQARSAADYLYPGPLWWAYDFQGADAQFKRRPQGYRPQAPQGWAPDQGVVLLIDEIDKADPDLPNAFLEVLGNQSFSVPYLEEPVVRGVKPPLVVITTNEERDLPPAFLRRCFVHVLRPVAELEEMGKRHLARRGLGERCHNAVLARARVLLEQDQARAREYRSYAPGLAEYLDLVIAVVTLEATQDRQMDLLKEASRFVLDKAAPVL